MTAKTRLRMLERTHRRRRGAADDVLLVVFAEADITPEQRAVSDRTGCPIIIMDR